MSNATQLLSERSFLTAGGTETYLLFQQQFPMREFCAFEIFEHDDALAELEQEYLYPLVSAVAENGHGLLLDALLWRAHPDYIEAIGYPVSDIERINRLAVARTKAAIDDWRQNTSVDNPDFPVLIAGDIGPRGDGYKLEDEAPTIEASYNYHRAQLEALAGSGADVISAWTMTNANESIGIAKAAEPLGLPITISPTVETNGHLPDGSTLGEFIERVDDATGALPVYYMVNCAHPIHLLPTLEAAKARGETWLRRFRGFRANSSTKSHGELDNSTELDRGNPRELAAELAQMKETYALQVVGGCCGTDHEHIGEIARATAVRY